MDAFIKKTGGQNKNEVLRRERYRKKTNEQHTGIIENSSVL